MKLLKTIASTFVVILAQTSLAQASSNQSAPSRSASGQSQSGQSPSGRSHLGQSAGVTAPVFACFAQIATLENRAENVDHATFGIFGEKSQDVRAKRIDKPHAILIAKAEILAKRKRSNGFYLLTEKSLSCHVLDKPQRGQAMGRTYRSWIFQLPSENSRTTKSARTYTLTAGKSKDNPEAGESYMLQTSTEVAPLTKHQSCLDPEGPELNAVYSRLASIIGDLHLDSITQKPIEGEKLAMSADHLHGVLKACSQVKVEKVQSRLNELRELLKENSAKRSSPVRSSKVTK